MSKRVRGAPRSRRPGARPATDRPAGARRRPLDERPSELEMAAIIAEDVVEERPVATGEPRVTPAAHHRQRTKPGSLLAARAATEYVYVAQDMRRIVIVSLLLFAVLVALWLALVVMRVVPLPFY